MTVPTPTFKDTNMSNTGVWTLSGSPAFATDRQGTTAIDADGVNDLAERAAVITASSGAQHSVSFWVKARPHTPIQNLIGQRDVSPTTSAVFTIQILTTTGEFISLWTSSGTLNTNFVLSTSSGNITDDTWRHYVNTINGNVCKNYLNGVETSYTAENTINGTGFTGVKAGGIAGITIASFSNQAAPLDGQFSRPKIWQGDTLSAIQVLKEYNNELALIGAGGTLPKILPFTLNKALNRTI